MDYLALKTVHLTGLVLTFMGLAGVLALKASGDAKFSRRWLFHASHALGLLLIISTGIAMIHALKLYEPTVPYWVKGKLFIWLLAAGSVALSVRLSRYALTLFTFYAAMVMAAAWLVLYRPF